MKKVALGIFLFVALLFLAITYIGIGMKPAITPTNNLPSREIVFSPEVHLPEIDEDTIGFINSDGGNFTTRKISIPINWMDGLPIKHYSSFVSPQMTWSSGGHFLGVTVGVLERMTGFPMLISTNGQFILCPKNSIPFTSERFWANDNGMAMILAAISEKTDHNTVILYDMIQCKQIKEIFSSDDYIINAALSTQNWLAVSVKSYIGVIGRTEIYSDEGRLIFTLPLTGDLSWSKDGEWLAYALYEKSPMLHVINKNGKEDQQITKITRSPSWSSDGHWIVFERDYQIRKVNILTKEEIKLAEGTYPNWRWNMPTTNK